MTAFDLAVIGAGSGNTIIGREWADKRVVLFDDADRFGGTCLNRGCIPTKMLVQPAERAVLAADAARLGVHFGAPRVDWPAIRDRVFGRIDGVSDDSLAFRQERTDNVTVVRETVGFAGPTTLETASGERFDAEQVVIAAGSRPRPLAAAYTPSDPRIHTSDSIMRADTLPERLLIVGSGVIAAEFAHIFAGLGVIVTVAMRHDRLLRQWDRHVRDTVTDALGRRVRLRPDTTVTEIDDGLTVTFDDGEREQFDAVLVALGRVPNTDVLGAATFFDLHEDGRIRVDAQLRAQSGGVPVPGVFALGDVCSAHLLKHVANHQARIVRANLQVTPESEGVEDTLAPIPSAVFTHPEVAAFGVRSDDAKDDDIVITHAFGDTAYGWALEDTESTATLVIGRDGRLRGAHIVGPSASLLLQPLVLLASQGQDIRGVARAQYWPHPALSEVIENALLRAEKELR